MSDTPPSNVKIYERPERQSPSPLILVLGLVIVLILAFILYKVFYHPAVSVKAPTGLLPAGWAPQEIALWLEKGL